MDGVIENSGLFKVMLVDDDLLMLEDLKKLIDWEKLGFQICGTAENGKQTLELCRRLAPDVVITDIRMPQMDGLELIRNLKTDFPDIQVLLLTAYSDFDYAKQAISLGVSAYLLKHEISAESMEKQLNGIKSMIQKKTDVESMVRRRYLEEFLCSPEDEQKKLGLKNELAAMSAVSCGVFLIAEPQRMSQFVSWKEKQTVSSHSHMREQISCQTVRDELYERFRGRLIAIPCEGSNVLAVAALEGAAPGQNGQFELSKSIAELFWQKCIIDGGHPTVVHKGGICSNLSWIYKAYCELVKNYRKTVLKAGRQIISVQELKHDQEAHISLPELNTLFLPTEKTQDEMKQYFSELCDMVKRSGRTEDLEKLLLYLQKLLDVYCEHEICTEAEVSTLQEEIGNCCSIKELAACMENFWQKVYSSPEAGCSMRVRKVIAFIQQNYMNEIRVSDAAETVGLNAEYLNKLFKKEVGEGFSHYLTAYRMKIAKQMLIEGEYRIGEIAEMVGYKSSQYFSVMFRQFVGEPPSAFIRRQ